jgi:membrane protein implicated in regulation of membrane protease activity
VVLTIFIILSFLVPWPWKLAVLLVGVIAEVGEVVWGRRLAKRWRPKTGAEAMIGASAEVVTPCRPNGQVRVHGELWNATCAVGAEVGETVHIAAVENLTLVVVPLAPADAEGR